MKWNEKCLLELTHHHVFENDAHRQRFRDLLDCYWTEPFFTKGLCKCLYLASWDDQHFLLMLDLLNQMVLDGATTLRQMKDMCEVMEQKTDGFAKEVFCLSKAFITNGSYQAADLGVMDPEGAHIIRRALLASGFIDELPDVIKL